jgi:hypothetical protein
MPVPEIPGVDLTALTKLEPGELRLLWVNDWYDGPLEAVVEHSGERRLMVLHAGDRVDVTKPMRWVLFRLSPDQWTDEERWHSLFEEHVGHHWCFHHATPPEESDEALDTALFYEPYAKRPKRDLDATAASGWVDEMPAH